MNTHNLKATERTGSGKSDTKRLRREGFIPATIYSRDRESQNIQIQKSSFDKEFPNKALGASLELDFGAETKLAIIKNVEMNHLKGDTLHVEFQQLTAGELITVDIPVLIVNRESVETTATIVQQLVNTIQIQAMPKDLIDNIQIDVKTLTMENPIHLSDLPIFANKDYKINTPENTVIVQLNLSNRVNEADAEDETTQEEQA